jgi:hypothetical protein
VSRLMRTRRRMFMVFGVAVAALVIGVSVGAAKSGPTQLKVQLQYHNGNCGFPTTKKFIGKAKVEAHKGKITVVGKLHGADPGKYELQLWDANCNWIANLDEFGVDSGGDGNFAGALVISGQQSFFIDVYNEDNGWDNDSLIFKLGGL